MNFSASLTTPKLLLRSFLLLRQIFYFCAGKNKVSSVIIIAIVASIIAFGLLLGMGYYFLYGRAKKKYNALIEENAAKDMASIESMQFSFKSIEIATSKFSDCNKLGKGGFGEVYKGILINGKEIAVKRLSKRSGQGAEEFKNEVVLVAKLQHRNLVRLLGFCLEGEEKILVYEYVPNKSLDYFLFDPKKRDQLDWSIRCNIIGGIARGVLYLHEDSRLKVIHRDLKASNVLLDKNMNPKISDFGMAKMFGVDQIQGNTARIVGTYGYMAPEYAMEGLYSIKSDVFSFGVLLLEILSGRRNTGFRLIDYAPSLVQYAWQSWNQNKVLELMDPSMNDSCPPNEFLRYIHIGLLCVQEDANKRPTMSAVVLMLKSDSLNLAQPQRPAFFVGRFTENHEIGIEICSVNAITISDFLPR
ncbi:cysteine-rich receptor-like protein kinase 10 isoform X2 [Ziziphus jujuba]|uniref:Cysteine-rich receptor-like protein kinase 10 isoform X2 n=1 Tax=Ziziphus jujuba TaxID=326968 RepID=A0A6P6FP92_ZIZJJ|nr:cysteine-rich receptor-like protein kinase 10 isoform X2 [Ziziphus jujuba]